VLSKFPEGERAEMADEDGVITVDCEFCSSKFSIRLSDFVPSAL
jgi:molecular chaperone Hsp33